MKKLSKSCRWVLAAAGILFLGTMAPSIIHASANPKPAVLVGYLEPTGITDLRGESKRVIGAGSLYQRVFVSTYGTVNFQGSYFVDVSTPGGAIAQSTTTININNAGIAFQNGNYSGRVYLNPGGWVNCGNGMSTPINNPFMLGTFVFDTETNVGQIDFDFPTIACIPANHYTIRLKKSF